MCDVDIARYSTIQLLFPRLTGVSKVTSLRALLTGPWKPIYGTTLYVHVCRGTCRDPHELYIVAVTSANRRPEGAHDNHRPGSTRYIF